MEKEHHRQAECYFRKPERCRCEGFPKHAETSPQPQTGLFTSLLCAAWQMRVEWLLILWVKWIPNIVAGSSVILHQGWICPRMLHTNAILPITKIIIRLISPPPFLSLPSVYTHTYTHTHVYTLFCRHVSHSYLCARTELHSSVSPERSQMADTDIRQVLGILCLGQ